ncbi:MAG: T9SS type A sorting domain-containing protein [Chitinophagales bacterium]
MEVYPNPVSDVLFLDIKNTKEAVFTIFDLNGKVVFTKNNCAPQSRLNIPVGDLAEGAYYFKLTGIAEEWVGKFVKIKK